MRHGRPAGNDLSICRHHSLSISRWKDDPIIMTDYLLLNGPNTPARRMIEEQLSSFDILDKYGIKGPIKNRL